MKKICSLFLISLFFAGMAHAADFAGVGGRPAHADPAIPHSSQWFIYTLNPGEKKSDELLVQNNSDEPVAVMLYPVDSTPSTDGGFALEQMVEPRDFVGAWIALSQDKVELGPRESKIVPFEIAVPNDPKLNVGEHTGGIIIQKLNQQAAELGGIQLLTRMGVRVYVTIPGEIVKNIEIEKFTVDVIEEKNVYVASLVVKNSGNVSQDVIMKVSVKNLYPALARWPIVKKWFAQFPFTNERNMQVLRDSSLASNVEFSRPPFGKLSVAGEMIYENENGTKTLKTQELVIAVPWDRNLALLLIFSAAFIVLVISLFLLKRYAKKSSRSKHR